jgi:hypothetical protein
MLTCIRSASQPAHQSHLECLPRTRQLNLRASHGFNALDPRHALGCFFSFLSSADGSDPRLLAAGGKRRVRSNVRSLITAIAALLGILVWSGSALADDYSVDVGIEIDAAKDAGTIGCVFEQECTAKLDSFELKVRIYVYRRDLDRARVYLSSGDLICCYFDYAVDSTVVDRRNSVLRLPLFKGMRARGGLYIQNKRVGSLYLRFHPR